MNALKVMLLLFACANASCFGGTLVQWCADNPAAMCACGNPPKDENCCVQEGGPCQADDDCCAGAKTCAANADGKKVCTAPQ